MNYLGIDVGSVSTDLVVIDEKNNVLKKLYLKTEGNPIRAVACGMKLLEQEFKAHGRAVAKLYPEIRTVFEIGGQDSKIILIKDGYVRDFAMNTVCAAGTGSFLDRQAERMGIKTSDIGQLALRADMPASIAGRCAVFAESDIIHKQQMGVSIENILAGMCRALVRNYMSNVAKGKRLEPGFCFQGGVSCNEGIKKAFEEEIGAEITVPEHNTVLGAVGAAIIAGEATAKNKSRFKGFDADFDEVHTEEFTCSGCGNSCQVVRLLKGEIQLGCFQDRCGRYQSGADA